MCSRIGSESVRLLDFPFLQLGLLISFNDFLIGLTLDLIESQSKLKRIESEIRNLII